MYVLAVLFSKFMIFFFFNGKYSWGILFLEVSICYDPC